MYQSTQFLLLNNALDYKIDVCITTLKIKKHRRLMSINTNNIISIKLEYTKYDTVNKSYFVITLVNGEKIYVNRMTAIPMGLLSASYTPNEDYDKVDNFVRTN